jgi:PAS domain S-box-containing protein
MTPDVPGPGLPGLSGAAGEILDAVSIAIVAIDDRGSILFFNRAAEKLFGYRADEVLGTSAVALIAPPYGELFLANVARYVKSGDRRLLETAREAEAVRKDGSRVLCEMTAGEVQIGGRRLFTGFVRDVSERRQAEAALLKAKESAETADRFKTDFLANMSHEIRTPMNAVIGMTGLLLDTDLTAEQRDYVETIRTSGDALLTLINGILDFSKIESGSLALDLEAFDLRECVEESIELVSAQAAEKGLELVFHVDEGIPAVYRGDVTRLRQVLLNLLSNAVKFTPKGEVFLSVGARPLSGSDYELQFQVRDTGIGIPADRTDRLFKSFSQVDSTTTRQFGGTGLGLAISAELVRLMGGTIDVASEVGKGSTFRFTVVAPFLQRSGVIRRHQPSLAGRGLLVVDDNATSRRVLEQYGRSWGMETAGAGSGAEALAIIDAGRRFDVALVDLLMPGSDGPALVEEIRRRTGASPLPIVLLAPLGMRDGAGSAAVSAAGGIAAGGGASARPLDVVATLTKPIRQKPLHDVLDALFAGDSSVSRRRQAEKGLAIRLADRLPLRILLAEDNVVNQKVALKLLEKLGYRADVAGNGIEVLQALRRQRYDVLLLDVQMPEMDGLEAARFIRTEWSDHQRPRILAMTANAMAGDRERCLEAGMDDYVSKPVQLDELQLALEQWGPEQSRPIPGSQGSTGSDGSTWRASLVARLVELFGLSEPGQDDVAEEIVASFLGDVPVRLAALRASIAAGDSPGTRQAAHALKGMCANVGADRLSGLCKVLEAEIETSPSLVTSRPLVDAIEREFGVVREFLRTKPWREAPRSKG